MSPAARSVSLITGASSGIGRAVAHRLAARGDHLVLAARGRRRLESTAAEALARGASSVHTAAIDVGDDSAVRDHIIETLECHGRLDCVVAAAGVVAYGRLEQIPTAVFDGVLRTNLLGAVNVARHAVGPMREQRSGAIVLIGSVVGHVAVPSMTPYVVSKWALRAFARQLRLENADAGITVCSVAPGGVDTPIYAHAAHYQRAPGRPPPPVISAEAVARLVERRLDDPAGPSHLPPSNHLLRLAFAAAPRLYDSLAGPFFGRFGVDPSREVSPTAGNVLAPDEEDRR